MMRSSNLATLEAYGALFETLSRDTLDELDRLVDPDVVFRDPFHEVRGRDAMKQVMAGMFQAFDAPSFRVLDLALGEKRGFVEWQFDSGTRGDSGIRFDGMSAVTFSSEATILTHVDHWDAASAIHARLPVLGPMVRMVNRTIARRSRAR